MDCDCVMKLEDGARPLKTNETAIMILYDIQT